jgi:hypothetical protein
MSSACQIQSSTETQYLENWDKWYEANKEQYSEGVKKWGKENPHKSAAFNAKHRATKLQAAPSWLEDEKQRIEFLYATAQATGLHVDHIVPLKHHLVCGLHCLDNLQLLEPKENIQKSNNFEVE